MKVFQLSAEARIDLGKKATKALRSEGKIPAVLNGGEIVELPYNGTLKAGEKVVEIGNGKGLITTDIVVTNDAVRKLVYTPDIYAIEIEVNGEKKMAVLKDIQFHPVKDSILHIDFLEVNEKKPVTVEVPVKCTVFSAQIFPKILPAVIIFEHIIFPTTDPFSPIII